MHFFPLRIVPQKTSFQFIKRKWLAFVFSLAAIVATLGLVSVKGLNFGIDFTGGLLLEVRFEQVPNIGELRSSLKSKDIGDVSIQTLGDPKDVLIRIGQKEGQDRERQDVIERIKNTLSSNYGPAVDYRKVDFVGPKVGKELIISGVLAMSLAVVAILMYIWFRFEWQYGLGAVVALIHDAILTLGFFSFTQLEFNLSAVAAILTVIGYSINDSVVIFDRIRDNIRKHKKMPMDQLLDVSINDNLSRTILTSLTTVIALLSLVLVGGAVIQSFSLAALFGVVIGTYSSIYVAAPILIYINPRSQTTKKA